MFDGGIEVVFLQGASAAFLILCRGALPGEIEFLLQRRIERRFLEGLPLCDCGFLPFTGCQMLIPALDVAGFKIRAATEVDAAKKDENRLKRSAQSRETHAHPVSM